MTHVVPTRRSSDLVSQPLRVEGGGLKLAVPVAYDYLTGSVSTEARQMALSPSGREIDVEASYGFSLGGGRMDANAYWRKDLGHIARSEEHTSELQSLMRISYAVFRLKKKTAQTKSTTNMQ